ncbi:MAG: gfo/Idh/MocA family oxidoreductase, partial [Verrucomicrobiales bacterium]|nr:gfo/Idh/MocA family oxidoreductase [Verrucomicrobiales bacterium]
ETGLYDPNGELVSAFEGQSVNHFANFLDAVRSRKQEDLKAEILEGHQSSSLCHLANISYRLGGISSIQEVQKRLGNIEVSEDTQETLDRTRHYLIDAGVDLEKTPMTLGQHLRLDGDKEQFLDNAPANGLLTREYRSPFVVPKESEI